MIREWSCALHGSRCGGIGWGKWDGGIKESADMSSLQIPAENDSGNPYYCLHNGY